MSSRIGRVAALLGVGASFALAFAAPAQAHHYHCNGYWNPECNVRYILDHWSFLMVDYAQPVVDVTMQPLQVRKDG